MQPHLVHGLDCTTDQLVERITKPSADPIATTAVLRMIADRSKDSVIERENFVKIEGLLAGLGSLLRKGSAEVRSQVAYALAQLALSDSTKKQIGEVPLIFLGLRDLMLSGTSTGKLNAVLAISNLADGCEANRRKAGKVPGFFTALVGMLGTEESTACNSRAALAVGNLAMNAANSQVIGGVPGVFDALVRLIEVFEQSATPNMKEIASTGEFLDVSSSSLSLATFVNVASSAGLLVSPSTSKRVDLSLDVIKSTPPSYASPSESRRTSVNLEDDKRNVDELYASTSSSESPTVYTSFNSKLQENNINNINSDNNSNSNNDSNDNSDNNSNLNSYTNNNNNNNNDNMERSPDSPSAHIRGNGSTTTTTSMIHYDYNPHHHHHHHHHNHNGNQIASSLMLLHEMNVRAVFALSRLALDETNARLIVATPGAVHALMELTCRGVSKARTHAARAFSLLAWTIDPSAFENRPDFFVGLMSTITQGSRKSRAHGALAIANLAIESMRTRMAIVNTEGMLPALVELLQAPMLTPTSSSAPTSQDNSSRRNSTSCSEGGLSEASGVNGCSSPPSASLDVCKWNVLLAIANLAKEPEIKSLIVSTPRALDSLLTAFVETPMSILYQSDTVLPIAAIANESLATKSIIAQTPTVIPALRAIITCPERSSRFFALNAALALGHLCALSDVREHLAGDTELLAALCRLFLDDPLPDENAEDRSMTLEAISNLSIHEGPRSYFRTVENGIIVSSLPTLLLFPSPDCKTRGTLAIIRLYREVPGGIVNAKWTDWEFLGQQSGHDFQQGFAQGLLGLLGSRCELNQNSALSVLGVLTYREGRVCTDLLSLAPELLTQLFEYVLSQADPEPTADDNANNTSGDNSTGSSGADSIMGWEKKLTLRSNMELSLSAVSNLLCAVDASENREKIWGNMPHVSRCLEALGLAMGSETTGVARKLAVSALLPVMRSDLRSASAMILSNDIMVLGLGIVLSSEESDGKADVAAIVSLLSLWAPRDFVDRLADTPIIVKELLHCLLDTSGFNGNFAAFASRGSVATEDGWVKTTPPTSTGCVKWHQPLSPTGASSNFPETLSIIESVTGNSTSSESFEDLRKPEVARRALTALADLVCRSGKALKTLISCDDYLTTLVGCMHDRWWAQDGACSGAAAAVRILCAVCCHGEDLEFIANTQGLLAGLYTTLHKNNVESSKSYACRALAALGQTVAGQMAFETELPEAYEAFAKLIHLGTCYEKSFAALAVASLITDSSQASEYCSIPNSLTGFTVALKVADEECRRHTSLAITKLASISPSASSVLGSCVPIVERMVEMLADGSESTRSSAALTLGILANVRSTATTIASMAGCITRLGILLTVGSVETKKHAAFALTSLAVTEANRVLIAGTSGVIHYLCQAMGDVTSPAAVEAARALASLAQECPENCEAIASQTEFCASVGALLKVQDHPHCRLVAAATIASICAESPNAADNLGTEPGVMDRLHELVPNRETAVLLALANLTRTPSNCMRLEGIPGSVEALCAIVSEPPDDAAFSAARVLANLSYDNEIVVNRITAVAGVLRALVLLMRTGVRSAGQQGDSSAIVCIGNLAVSESNCEAMGNIPGIFVSLCAAIRAGRTDVKQSACQTLCNLVSECENNRVRLMEVPAGFSTISGMLKVGQQRIESAASRTIAKLALSPVARVKLGEIPGLLQSLLDLMRIGCSDSKDSAVMALSLMTEKCFDICNTYSNLANSLDILGDILLSNGAASTRSYAALTIANLARESFKCKTKLGARKELISGLASLVIGSDAEGRGNAALALANLAWQWEPNKKRIVADESALKALCSLFAPGHSVKERTYGALALASIASDSPSCCVAIADTPNAIESLAATLSWQRRKGGMDSSSSTCSSASTASSSVSSSRANSALAVAMLAAEPRVSASKMGDLGRLLSALEEMVREGSNVERLHATLAIANLSCKPEVGRNRELAQELGSSVVDALALVLHALSGTIRSEAARALGNFAADDQNALVISQNRGVLEGLKKTIEEEKKNVQAQANAALALANVTADPQVALGVFKTADLVPCLVELIGEDKDITPQADAALVLANLAGSNKDNAKAMSKIPGVIEGVVWLLMNGNADGRMNAAMGIANLAIGSQRIRQHLMNIEGLCEGLFALLAEGSPAAMKEAARAIDILVTNGGHVERGTFGDDLETFECFLTLLGSAPEQDKKNAAQLLASLVMTQLATRKHLST